ncbi:MAG TPA: hypothetical protein QGF05_12360, partial [Dehalococcoidia bacterium]|nr:hypothetical protein [Dehalococcoidia bacterium]
IYIVLFRVLHGWIFDRLEPFVTREFTAERSAFAVRLALYMVFGAIVIGVNLVIDYAKVRAVVEDRRSMVGAVLAGLRFARRRPLKTAGLYLMNGALFVAIVALYASLAPWVGHSGGAYWMSFALGQAYIFGRVWAKLVFYATQTAFFQGELAHAGYVATPLPVWPDSPAADSLGSTRDPG